MFAGKIFGGGNSTIIIPEDLGSVVNATRNQKRRKMPKYKIQMFYPADGHKGFEEVRGYPVSIPWLKGVELFAHRPYKDNELSGLVDYWNISEVKTGLALITHCRGTKAQTIDALRAKLSKIETDDISRWLENLIDIHITGEKKGK